VRAVEAVSSAFNLYALNTTLLRPRPPHGEGPAASGLARVRLKLLLGQSGAANATIGRAGPPRHAERGGSIPGAVSKSVSGSRRVSLLRRWEERARGRLHVPGFAPADSVVTAAVRYRDAGHRRHVGRDREELIWVRPLDRRIRNEAGADMHSPLCPTRHKTRATHRRAAAADAPRSGPRADRALHARHWRSSSGGYVEGNTVIARAPSRAVPDRRRGRRVRPHALYFCTFGLTWSVSKRFGSTRRIPRRVLRAARSDEPDASLAVAQLRSCHPCGAARPMT